jgi:NTE family protein
LLIVAVDAVSGERRVFTGEDGVSLAVAVASSSAIPGLCPPVEVNGNLYMDGGVHSSTNADLIIEEHVEQVWIAMPFNAVTAPAIGGLAERMLENEVAALRAAGCEVSLQTPSAEDARRCGSNLMDYARIDEGYSVGLEAGRQWALRLSLGSR